MPHGANSGPEAVSCLRQQHQLLFSDLGQKLAIQIARIQRTGLRVFLTPDIYTGVCRVASSGNTLALEDVLLGGTNRNMGTSSGAPREVPFSGAVIEEAGTGSVLVPVAVCLSYRNALSD
jgi:hypothetical protein